MESETAGLARIRDDIVIRREYAVRVAPSRNLFKATAASGQATVGSPDSQGLGRINQGFVEGSNVNIVEELVNMISAQRIYETNSKVITAADRMLGTINQAVS